MGRPSMPPHWQTIVNQKAQIIQAESWEETLAKLTSEEQVVIAALDTSQPPSQEQIETLLAELRKIR